MTELNLILFDAVLYDNEKRIYAIIEFKSYATDKPAILNTKQLNKYRRFGLPVYVITRLNQIPNAISKLKNLL